MRPDYGTIFYMDEQDTTHVMFTAAGFCELGDAVGSSAPGIEFVEKGPDYGDAAYELTMTTVSILCVAAKKERVGIVYYFGVRKPAHRINYRVGRIKQLASELVGSNHVDPCSQDQTASIRAHRMSVRSASNGSTVGDGTLLEYKPTERASGVIGTGGTAPPRLGRRAKEPNDGQIARAHVRLP